MGKITLPVKGTQSGQQLRGNSIKMKEEKWWGNGGCIKNAKKPKIIGVVVVMTEG